MRRQDDDGTSPVVGILLMLPVAVSLAMAVAFWAQAKETHIDAERAAAEKAAWCARNPNREWPGNGTCPSYGPRGYVCEEADLDVGAALKCVPVDGPEDPDDYTLLRNCPSENITCDDPQDGAHR